MMTQRGPDGLVPRACWADALRLRTSSRESGVSGQRWVYLRRHFPRLPLWPVLGPSTLLSQALESVFVQSLSEHRSL